MLIESDKDDDVFDDGVWVFAYKDHDDGGENGIFSPFCSASCACDVWVWPCEHFSSLAYGDDGHNACVDYCGQLWPTCDDCDGPTCHAGWCCLECC